MRTAVSVIATLLFLGLSDSKAQEVKVAPTVQPSGVPGFVGFTPDRIVVKFDQTILTRMNRAQAAQGKLEIPDLDRLAEQYGVRSIVQQFPGARPKRLGKRVIDLSGWHILSLKTEQDAQAMVEAYRSIPGVLDAQPVGVHAVDATPNDPRYVDQWHLDQANDHDIDGPEAWDVETGKQDILVANLDTGVRYMHKDLGGANASWSTPEAASGNMWINTAERGGVAGVDDDGNGYIDDWIGWDFVSSAGSFFNPCVTGEDCSTEDNDPRDFNGHGTHTSGIVAALNNNGYAVSSAAGGWGDGSLQTTGNGVRIMALRIGWSGRTFFIGGSEVGYVSMDFAAQAFRYAADNGADIASCSWSSSNSGGLGDAIDYFLATGGLIFKSAGNAGNEATDYMTAREDIISVAATDASDVRASFSSYGTWVDISAPGEDIMSLYHVHTDETADYVASASGTSMAAPLAAGVAALIWSRNPSWTAAQVRQRLFDTADDIDGLAGNSSYAGKLGAGRVNAYNALNTGGPTPPAAAFTGSPTSGCSPLAVSFTDQSTGEITSWSWTFGDGGTSTTQSPSHTFNAVGTYEVSLTATGPGGSDTETKTGYITVSTSPVAEFSGTPISGNAPLTVTFSDLSTGSPTSWSWNFGDGGTSTTQNPSHQYSAVGTYTISLTATNGCGSTTETKTGYISVSEGPAVPVAEFSGTPTSGCSPLEVSFTDQSTGEVASWSWAFGDGGTSTAQSPSHTYNGTGTYEVSLTVTGPGGSDTETKTGYITVSTSPVADFSGTPTSGNTPLTVSFSDLSTGNPTSWSWTFGDGGTSTTQSPSHQYSAAGTYTVSLTATNACGSSTETKSGYITVSEPTAQTMHVQLVQVTKLSFFNFLFRGNVSVRIVDAGGSPVEGASVSGSWSGGASGSSQFTTNSGGEGSASSGWTTGNPDFTFCVDDLAKEGWTYDAAANEMTCGTSTGSSTATIAAANVENPDLKSVLENSAVAYPNPFNPSTTISFYLPEASPVKVQIYDILGRSVKILLDDNLNAGVNSVRWDGTDASGRHVGSGQYIYRISAANGTNIVRRMMLLK
jgi:PKD repeat protein